MMALLSLQRYITHILLYIYVLNDIYIYIYIYIYISFIKVCEGYATAYVKYVLLLTLVYIEYNVV
jgi:hypothetical protein